MKRKTKQERGITLVALIITIIVLLILAVVTIASVTGDRVINHAENARDAYKKAQQDENSILKNYEAYLDRNALGTDNPNSLVAKFKAGELHVGDYVDYKPTKVTTAYDPDNGIVGSKTGYTDEAQSFTQENLHWQVMGYDETKNQILLIASTPTTATLTLYGHVGYNNGENVLKDICAALYSNSTIGATARSVTMNDIDTYLGGSAYDKTTFGGGSSNEGGYGYQQEYTNINTPQNWKGMTENYECLGEWSGTLTSAYYEYSVSEIIIDTIKQNLIAGKNIFSEGFYYWISTCGNAGASWGMAEINDGYIISSNDNLCISTGQEEGTAFCLRPVISLSSKADINQVPILTGAPTETWNDPLGWYE